MGILRGDHYEAEVNKGSINMSVFSNILNKRWKSGWTLDHVYSQDGNTIMVWARRPEEAD